jgi:hypothetical protein
VSNRSLKFYALFAALLITGSAAAQNQGKLKTPGSYRNPYTRADMANRVEDESADARREAWKQRLNGDLTPDFAANLTREIERQRQLYPQQVVNNAGTSGSWINIGPTNASRFQNGVTQASTDSGRLRNIIQDPTDPNTVYVLVGVGGLWKTSNFFAQKPNWVPLTDSIGTAGGGVALGTHPGTIYYGTGDPVDWGVGGAMYRSIDGGQTWSAAVQLANVTDMGTIAVAPVSGGSDIVMVGTNHGLFRSTDGGTSYSLAGGIATSRAVWSIVRTSAGWLASAKNGTFTGSGPGEFYLSTDNGANWSSLPTPAAFGRATLGVARPGEATVYAFAATTSGGNQKDLYKSTDGGLTWTALGLNSKAPVNPDPYTPTMNLMLGQAWYNQLLVVDPTDTSRNTVYIGGVYSSGVTTDGGNSWRVLSSWLGSYKDGKSVVTNPYVHADMHTALVGVDQKGNKVVFFGSDGGIFYSLDNGKSFRSNANEGLVTHMIYAIASTPVRPDAVVIGLQDNGTRYRNSSTTTYNGVIGGDGFGTGWSQANNDISMGSVYYGAIQRFTQNPPNIQNKYDDVSIPLTDRGDEIFYTPLTTPTAKADPTGHVFFTATQSLVYRTRNAGTVWEPILDLFTLPDASYYFFYGTHLIGVSPTDLNRIGVAAYSEIDLTTDGGQHWITSPINVPNFNSYANNVGFSADNKWMYVSSEARDTLSSTVRVAKRDMATGNWVAAGSGDTGLPNVPVFKVAVDASVPDGSHVFAGTWIGVYETKDGGASWHLFGSGLPSTIVSDIYLFPDGKKIRIGTYGRGVWEMPL